MIEFSSKKDETTNATFSDVIEDSKADDSPRIADEAANRANNSFTAVKTESSKTTHLDDSPDDNYADSLMTAKNTDTSPSNIRDKDLDNYYDVSTLQGMIPRPCLS